jgi:hypothetical protein
MSSKRVPVPDYDGLYEIDALGNVYSLERKSVRVNRGRVQNLPIPARRLSRTSSRKGYAQVTLCRQGKQRTVEVHRLVCRAFHGEPLPGQEVAHLDGDPANPAASNLVWASRTENHAHKRRHGTRLTGERLPSSVLTEKAAVDIVEAAAAGEPKRAIARRFGVSDRAVRKIVAGEMWAEQTLTIRTILKEHPNDQG